MARRRSVLVLCRAIPAVVEALESRWTRGAPLALTGDGLVFDAPGAEADLLEGLGPQDPAIFEPATPAAPLSPLPADLPPEADPLSEVGDPLAGEDHGGGMMTTDCCGSCCGGCCGGCCGSSGLVASVTALSGADEAAPSQPGSFRFSVSPACGSCCGSYPSSVTVSFDLSGAAIAGTDYTGALTNRWVTVPLTDGSGSVDVPFYATDDSSVEPSEDVNVTLAVSSGYDIAPGGGSATTVLADDDVNIDVASGLHTFGVASEVEVRATDYYGNGKSVTLAAQSGAPGILTVGASSVVTGSDGKAMVPVTGVELGQALLIMAAPDGNVGQAGQEVAPAELKSIDTGPLMYEGQTEPVFVVVMKAGGDWMKNEDRIPGAEVRFGTRGDFGQRLTMADLFATTDASGVARTDVIANDETAPHVAFMTATALRGTGETSVKVLPIRLTAQPHITGFPIPGVTIEVFATDAADPNKKVSGVEVQVAAAPEAGDTGQYTIMQGRDATSFPDGKATLVLQTTQAGRVHVQVQPVQEYSHEPITLELDLQM